MIDKLRKIARHVEDVNVPVEFISSVDGRAYEVTVMVTDLDTPANTYNVHIGTTNGGNINEKVSIPCNFSLVPAGSNYKIEVFTDVGIITDGRLARGTLTVFNKDGYSA